MPLKNSLTARSTSPAFTDAATALVGAGFVALVGALLDGADSEAEAVVSAGGVERVAAEPDDPDAFEPPSENGSRVQKAISPASSSATRAAATHRPRPPPGPRSGCCCGRAGGGATGGGGTGRGPVSAGRAAAGGG